VRFKIPEKSLCVLSKIIGYEKRMHRDAYHNIPVHELLQKRWFS